MLAGHSLLNRAGVRYINNVSNREANHARRRTMARKIDIRGVSRLSRERHRATFYGRVLELHQRGCYQCRCCGEKLFLSDSKFDAGCGWPSFFQAADAKLIDEVQDRSLGMMRTEVMCKACGAHLGHVFEDGPAPTGLRYCINSVSIKLKEAGS